MPLIIAVATVSVVAVGITFFLADRSHWRKILLVIGIVAAALSGLQAYTNRERADVLQNELGALQQKQEYWEVARLNVLGVHFVGGDLVDHTGLNDIIGPYVRFGANGKVEWDCSPSSVDAYSAAIKYDSKFPFSYFYRASCYSITNANDWHRDIETARSILVTTTQIPGHLGNHDEILKMIDNGNLGNRTR
jgi:hypothetical protein